MPDEESMVRTEETVFSDLYEAHYPDLVRYARSFAAEPEGAQDMVQEAFLRLWRRRATLDENRSVRALLYTAVRNLVLNEKRDVVLHRDLIKGMKKAAAPPSPEELTNAALIGEKMRGGIKEFPDRRREAFELSRFYGLSYKEIAGIMGISPKTVENHIQLALKALQEKLRNYDPQLMSS